MHHTKVHLIMISQRLQDDDSDDDSDEDSDDMSSDDEDNDDGTSLSHTHYNLPSTV